MPKIACKYIVDDLRRRLAGDAFMPGDALPSENKLAERYAVSRPTIRKALKFLAEEKLVSCLRGDGWRVSLRPGSSVSLDAQGRSSFVSGALRAGLLSMEHGPGGLERDVAFGSYFFSAAKTLKARGCEILRLLKEDLTDDPDSAARLLSSLDVLLVSVSCVDSCVASLLAKWGRPVVLIQHEAFLALPFHQVIPDLASGFGKAVSLMERLNARSAVCVSALSSTHDVRVSAFFETLKSSSLAKTLSSATVREERIISDRGRLLGRVLGERLLKDGLPDVVVSVSDFISFGLLDAFFAKGLKPGVDFKLISYDDLEGAGLLPFGKPVLTSICNPRDEISRQAAEFLLSLNGKDDLQGLHAIRIPCEIVERSSAFAG